jgi:hypothetical protein
MYMYIVDLRDTSTGDDEVLLADINFQENPNLEDSNNDIKCTKISKEIDDGSQWRLRCSVTYR